VRSTEGTERSELGAHASACAPTVMSPPLRGAMQCEAVEGHGFGLQRIELDLGELAFGDFQPAVDAGLALLDFAAVQAAEKIPGVIARGDFTQGRPGQGFDGVAAQELAPVVIEEVAGGEDVAPGDFAAVGHDHADDALTL